jgi:hypothetical protein
MHKPSVCKPLVISLVAIYGVGYGAGYFKDVPTKALSLLATATSTTSIANFKMPDMINNNKEYDLKLVVDTRRPTSTV